MKITALIISLLVYCCAYAQQPEPELHAATESQLEAYAAHVESVPQDDAHWQQLQAYTRRKINLNTTDAAVLRSLGILSAIQLQQFFLYRQQMGTLLSIYELQVIPGFDETLINSLLPYVQVGNDLEPHYKLKDYLRKGEHVLLFRYGRQLESSRGYADTDSTSPHYVGSPDRLLLRYRYNFPAYISWGAVMEKDAGEAFLKGAQGKGFDFYSLHLFVKKYKCIRALALGDFTVNMGQGLLNWQSLAFEKGAAVMQVNREGELLRPYASAGEYNFFRGAGITIGQGIWQGTAFVSARSLDGSITNSSGYHRSLSELSKRHTLQQFTTGGNVTMENRNWKLGINYIQHHLSAPVQKGNATYQLFAFEGRQLTAVSVDYAATYRQLHFFGEGAMSGNGKTAFINGVLISAAANADLVLLYRSYNRAYQSFYADAWGEFYRPVNEKGIYTGISVKINRRLKLDAYADVFRFPWLQSRSSAPGGGRELLAALTYTPDKQTAVFLRYTYALKQQDGKDEGAFLPSPVRVTRRNWRLQSTLQVEKELRIKTRIEVNDYWQEQKRQQGFLLFQEVIYQCAKWPLQLYIRYTRFVSEGTESSIYAVTAGMLYEYGVSRFSGEGHLYQLRIRWKIRKGLTCWMRYQQTVYGQSDTNGSGWNEVTDNSNSLVQCQFQYLF